MSMVKEFGEGGVEVLPSGNDKGDSTAEKDKTSTADHVEMVAREVPVNQVKGAKEMSQAEKTVLFEEHRKGR